MADEIKEALELGTAGTEIAKSLGQLPIIGKIIGLAEGEIDVYWGISQDRRRKDRLARAASMLRKTDRMIEEAERAGEVKEVPAKLLDPLIEASSLEDDEDMQNRWAALLASAALPTSGVVRPSFISALRTLSSDAARILSYMWDLEQFNRRRPEYESPALGYQTMPKEAMVNYFKRDGLDYADLDANLDELESLRLIDGVTYLHNPNHSPNIMLTQRNVNSYMFTDLGWAFIEACQPPKKREPES